MPWYDFICPSCKKMYKDVNVKLSEKESFVLTCECGSDTIQKVAGLKFELKGMGWFRDSQSGEGYSITETESRRNLEYEKKAEDYALKVQEQDRKLQ
jgi:putative FmdB family regulatory protein